MARRSVTTFDVLTSLICEGWDSVCWGCWSLLAP